MIAVSAPALSPDEAARRAAARPGAFWLTAPAADGVGVARDLVGTAPIAIVGRTPDERDDGLAALERTWRAARAAWGAAGEPVAAGIPVAVGWLSYELGRRLVGLAPDPRAAWATLEFHVHDAVWVREADGAATIFARDAAAAARLGAVLSAEPPAAAAPAVAPLAPDAPDAVFLDGVTRILDYLHAGDAYQVNLSRRLSAPCGPGEPTRLAAALRARAPAPHAAFLAAVGGGAVVSNSPERFLSVDPGGVVETRPIKGTRPRGPTPEADRDIAAALVASAKDRAEHVMIVDLERNDLGRVCRTGSVELASLAALVSLPTVHHLVSTVRGRLRDDVDLRALVAATFPGGSITGAPKRRAMQIIDELEPAPRELYTGAIGWLGAAGDLDLAIAIRTALVRDGRLTLSVGGGIVADSTPAGELDETAAKARAFTALTTDVA